MTFTDYKDTIRKEIKHLMDSDAVVKLKFKSLNNNRDEEAVQQLVLDGFMQDLTPDEVVQQIATKAGIE